MAPNKKSQSKLSDTYEGNGDYSYNNDEETDFKRKSGNGAEENNDHQQDGSHINEKANEYLKDCILEKSKLDKKFPICERLLDAEIEKVQTTGRIPTRDPKYVDIYREKPVRVAQKILVPVREHPKFNFVGKLLGPKGNSLRRLQEETLCKMTVLGRNSMKDRVKEEELRNSLDPKYAHLNDDLHVEISTIAPPAEAHARIAYAMAELRKYLIPDSNDIIRQEQLRELMDNPPVEGEAKPTIYKPRTSAVIPKPSYIGYRPPAAVPHAPQTVSRTPVPPKQKVLSILDRARTAMEEPYRGSYNENYSYFSRHYEEQVAYEAPVYDSYSYAHAPPPRSAQYETAEYEPEYRREYYQPSPSYTGASKASARSWKTTSVPATDYYQSSSRRHVDEVGSSSKHSHSSREARYKSAPYPKTK
ncbi:KH domain-containing, RNA-binding, signal transduction-associated protein 3 isoform X2 [Condylostylus longicornis]|uniref:KH domain-containing, RNA-binding, signal transduction-associated protein 3 isoform X2 n=1 Tax=Condylostylus longicornis TaxID=2530218 RepID=UPI00244DB93E|nr:KH domain-containing, RNA-binding, signal transduction-associated protein 3 isoform X2 [Condylostylus longicornis]